MVLRVKGIPRAVWALGFVSMFMDVSSEMIHCLLPVFLVTVIGSSALSVGWIEGVAQFFPSTCWAFFTASAASSP